MSFDLFGIDIIPSEYGLNIGFWFCNIKQWSTCQSRNLIAINYDAGAWRIDVLWIKIVGD